LTPAVNSTPAASVTQGRHVPGERMNARYVAVALVAAIIDECPEKNESVASVSEIEGDLSAPPYCASRAACALYAIGRGRRNAILVRSVMAKVSESDSAERVVPP